MLACDIIDRGTLPFVVGIPIMVLLGACGESDAISSDEIGPAAQELSGALVSGDFHSDALNTSLWTIVDPVGDATVELTGTQLAIGVKKGMPHDVWTGNNSVPQVQQTVADTDFEVVAKFESVVNQRFQQQGFLIQADNMNLVRAEVLSDGSGARLFAATLENGVATSRMSKSIDMGTPHYLRVTREGDRWTVAYSPDGTNWTLGSFEYPLAVSTVGVYAGNAFGKVAHTALIDYVFNTASPISPEDGEVDDTTPPQVTNINVAAGETSATVSWETNELSIGVVEYGLTNSYELGSVSSSPLANAHAVTLAGLSGGQVYHYRIIAEDSLGNSVTGADDTFTAVASVCVVTTDATNGTILRDPDLSSYICGDVVTLTAQPDAGATFVGWGGDLSGTTNPVTFTVDTDATVTAIFAIDTTPPQVTNINVAAGETSATVSWETNELSIGVVEYGLTNSYELGSVSSSPLANAHAVTLAGLSGGQVYHYRIIAEDSLGNSVTGADDTFTAVASVCVVTTDATNGTILRDPDLSSYICGDVVTLTAQPDAGATFVGWGGDLSGTTNPVTFTVDTDATVTAIFAIDTTPPQVTNINVAAGETSATVSWETNELSIGVVEYGLTNSYELGSVSSSPLANAHAVTLAGLSGGQVYHYRIIAEDSLGNSVTGADDTFTAVAGGAGSGGTGGSGGGSASAAFLSDDFFDGAVDPVLWEVVDPRADGTVRIVGAGTSDAQLLLSVPAGTKHDAWTTNTTLRVMQPAADDDFELEVKFESEPTQKYQGQGVLVEQDPSNYIRFDLYSDGTYLRAFVATFTNGSSSVKANQKISTGPTTYLRLTRNVDQWSAQYSFDGLTWTTAATFAHALTVTAVGPFASNFNPNPAFTAVVDYFFEVGSPIDPEDELACAEDEQFTVAVSSSGPGTVVLDPALSSYGCGDEVTLTAEPDPGAAFVGWRGTVSGTSNPATLTVNADASIAADFAVDTSPPKISNVSSASAASSATISWTTDEVSTGLVEYGLTTSYELGNVASSASSTAHSVTLNGLLAEQIYHFRITAEDGLANSATTGDYTFTTASSSGGATIDVWYGPSQRFGSLGIPQQWVNILGNVTDPDGISALSYSLNGGPEETLSVGPDKKRLAEPGDFNVEIDHQVLNEGINTVDIIAKDTFGGTTIETVEIDFRSSAVWPLPYFIDWSSVLDLQDVIQVADGQWTVVPDGIRNEQIAYDRLLALGDLQWDFYEITVPITVHSINERTSHVVGMIMRWAGHTDQPIFCAQPHCGWSPNGAFIYADYSDLLKVHAREHPDFQLELGVKYYWKVRVQEANGVDLYAVKIWEDGTNEPLNWTVSALANSKLMQGSLLLIAHNVEVTFGDITVLPVDGSDPLLVSNVQVNSGDTWATFSWSTDRPASGSVSYGVDRSTVEGAVSEESLQTSHTITVDGLLPDTSYYFQVSSVATGGETAIFESTFFTQ